MSRYADVLQFLDFDRYHCDDGTLTTLATSCKHLCMLMGGAYRRRWNFTSTPGFGATAAALGAGPHPGAGDAGDAGDAGALPAFGAEAVYVPVKPSTIRLLFANNPSLAHVNSAILLGSDGGRIGQNTAAVLEVLAVHASKQLRTLRLQCPDLNSFGTPASFLAQARAVAERAAQSSTLAIKNGGSGGASTSARARAGSGGLAVGAAANGAAANGNGIWPLAAAVAHANGNGVGVAHAAHAFFGLGSHAMTPTEELAMRSLHMLSGLVGLQLESSVSIQRCQLMLALQSMPLLQRLSVGFTTKYFEEEQQVSGLQMQ
jgi:hypothetical protein